MDNNYTMERELGWEDTIEKENEFILLPEGDYDFRVEKYERARFAGSDKMPACPMAIVYLAIEAGNGQSVTVKHNLMLHTKTEWALSAFFGSIGQKKKGEKLKMNWNYVPGSTGRLKLGVKTYNGNQYNEIKKFYHKDDVKPAFTPGAF